MTDGPIDGPIVDEGGSVASGALGMFNAFVDPAGLAKAAKAKLFWLWPLLVTSVVAIVVFSLMAPYSMQIAEARMAQQNIPPDSMERARKISSMIIHIMPYIVPIGIVLVTMLLALLVNVTASMTGMRTKFRDIFSLMMACSLISCLQIIATYVVLRVKGDEVTTQEQMTPPFGLDIFIPAHGALLAVLNYFSIFQIWYLVMLALSLAYMTNSTKGKAFFAITPAWILPLLLKVVGSFFTPPGS